MFQDRGNCVLKFKKGTLKCSDIVMIVFVILVIGIIILWKPLRMDRYSLIPSKIDWVDCIKVNERMYYNNTFPREEIVPSEVGKKLGKVKFVVSEKVSNSSYKFRNFDASYLEKGTNIYEVLNNEDLIAVEIDGKYYRYQYKSYK